MELSLSILQLLFQYLNRFFSNLSPTIAKNSLSLSLSGFFLLPVKTPFNIHSLFSSTPHSCFCEKAINNLCQESLNEVVDMLKSLLTEDREHS